MQIKQDDGHCNPMKTRLESPDNCFCDYRQYYIKIINIASCLITIFAVYLMISDGIKEREQCTKYSSNCHDRMFFSGVLVVSAALILAVVTDRDPMKVLRQLHRTSVISLSCGTWYRIKMEIRNANIVSCFLGAIILFFVSRGLTENLRELPYVLAYVLTGVRFGRMVANGTVGWLLKKRGSVIYVNTSNSDGAGGFAVVGDFCTVHTSALLVPLCWIIYWLIDMLLRNNYVGWFSFFLLLIVVVVATALGGLFWPLSSFRKMIIDWKQNQRLYCITADLIRKDRNDPQIYSMSTIPDWPISRETLRTAALGTVLPIVLTVMAHVRIP